MSDATQMMGALCLREIKLELGTLLGCATVSVAAERLSGNAVKEAFARGEQFAVEYILAIVEDKLEAARILELNKTREPK